LNTGLYECANRLDDGGHCAFHIVSSTAMDCRIRLVWRCVRCVNGIKVANKRQCRPMPATAPAPNHIWPASEIPID
jgi:hypothetical protein